MASLVVLPSLQHANSVGNPDNKNLWTNTQKAAAIVHDPKSHCSNHVCEADFVHAWREELEDVERSFSKRFADVLRLLYSTASTIEGDACTDPLVQAQKVAAQNPTCAQEVTAHLKALLDFANTNSHNLCDAIMEWDEINSSNLFLSLRFELMSCSFHHSTVVARLLDTLTSATTTASVDPLLPNIAAASTTTTIITTNTTTVVAPTPPSTWLPNLVSELVKLEGIVRSTSGDLLGHLVAHRGFHCTTDRIHRPIENTLQAMEQAWVHGLHYCECDITLTLDGQLVLAHDTTFRRLSLFPHSNTAAVPIHTLPFRDLIASPLKSGVRPALLRDVLESAARLGSPSQLVIELKHGTPNTPQALVRFFASNPSFIPIVAVVMSFDLEMIHDFAHRIQQLSWSMHANDEGDTTTNWPKVMFLTCAPGRQEYSYEIEVGVENPGLLKSFLVRPNSKLDGVYMEFERSMVVPDSNAQMILRQLCQSMTIGVWGAKPDNAVCAKTIADLGVKFVNTDLPSTFMQNGTSVLRAN